jgi:crotonobetainyl-CoA:carnitine CoA-transferase CaiB-like acyl-CoA transferase
MMTGRVPIVDETSALVNLGALMVGLYHKKMSGEGTKIETSLLGSSIRLMGWCMTRVIFTDEDLARGRVHVSGGALPSLGGSFNDKNGRGFTIQMGGEALWQKGMAAVGFSKRLSEVGCAELAEVAKSEEKIRLFQETLDKLFATDTRERWVKTLRDCDIVCTPINTLLEASKDPDVIVTCPPKNSPH